MRILIDIGHPGHVHLFRNCYFELIKKHSVFVTVRNIPIALALLDYYKIPYINLGDKKDTILGKAITILKQDYKIYKIVNKEKIELGLSSGIVLSHISRVTKMKSIMFDDDDDSVESLVVKFGHPFTNSVLSPSSIIRKTRNNIPYPGTHELAYLHPNRFKLDERVINEIGLTSNDIYFVLRFVAFKGHHDVGQYGITLEQKRLIISELEKYGRVFITAEREVEPEFEKYRIPVPPEKIHSFIYFATLFLGDSQTMTSEAAILGVPALKCNTFAGTLSVPNELESKYGLCYSFKPADFNLFYERLKQLLSQEGLAKEWQDKREKFLNDKIDVTSFMIWFIENYPKSITMMKTAEIYRQFK